MMKMFGMLGLALIAFSRANIIGSYEANKLDEDQSRPETTTLEFASNINYDGNNTTLANTNQIDETIPAEQQLVITRLGELGMGHEVRGSYRFISYQNALIEVNFTAFPAGFYASSKAVSTPLPVPIDV